MNAAPAVNDMHCVLIHLHSFWCIVIIALEWIVQNDLEELTFCFVVSYCSTFILRIVVIEFGFYCKFNFIFLQLNYILTARSPNGRDWKTAWNIHNMRNMKNFYSFIFTFSRIYHPIEKSKYLFPITFYQNTKDAVKWFFRVIRLSWKHGATWFWVSDQWTITEVTTRKIAKELIRLHERETATAQRERESIHEMREKFYDQGTMVGYETFPWSVIVNLLDEVMVTVVGSSGSMRYQLCHC